MRILPVIPPILSVVMLFVACGGDDDTVEGPGNPVQILSNPGVEDGSGTPDSWAWAKAGPQPGNNYAFEWSAAESHSGSRSLMIKLDAVTASSAFAYWNQLVDSNIPHGKKLVLSAAVKTNLSGEGGGMMVRADDAIGPVVWATTQGEVSITGVQDWHVVSTTLPNVPGEITELRVFLMLFPNTTGTIYFDDIELTYN